MNHPSAPAAHEPSLAPLPLQKTICLTGFMGAGKSTLGGELAKRLGCTFTDLDNAIEARTGKTVPAIFAEQGEPAFRELEYRTLRTLLGGGPPQVMAVGGGAYIQPQIAALLEGHGVLTIFLDAPPEELYQRCVDSLGASPRPLLKDLPSFRKLYAERLPFYRRAEVHLCTSGAPVAAVVEQIMDRLRESGAIPQRKQS